MLSKKLKIKLKKYEAESSEKREAVALDSQPKKHLVEDGYDDGAISVSSVSGKLSELKIRSSDGESVREEEAEELDPKPIVSSKIEFSSSDGKSFEVEESVALDSQPIIEHDRAPLANVSRKIRLLSWDKKSFEVEEEVAFEFKRFAAKVSTGDFIDTHVVAGKVLAKVIDYCKKHVEFRNSDDPGVTEEINKWDAEFIKVEQILLFDIFVAAYYLKIYRLRSLTFEPILEIMQGMTDDEIDESFRLHYSEEDERCISILNIC